MIIIIGLGNPGKKFQKTRHNLGFIFVDYLKRKYQFPSFQIKEDLFSKISSGKILKEKVILVKPQTFMNLSGEAVKAIKDYFKVPSEQIWVIHDDLDLPLGKAKISKGKGSGGHKGVQSIIDSLKTKNFIRFRIGIMPKDKKVIKKEFVLDKFSKEELRIILPLKKKLALALETAIEKGINQAMEIINQ